MNFKSLLVMITLLASNIGFSQKENINLGANLKLPEDSIVSQQLLSALNSFLSEKDKPNEEINLILPTQKAETFILIDELKDIEKSGKYQDENFYKPYLMNVVKLSDNEYYTMVSYIGISDTIPILRANFEIIAHKRNDGFVFSSPLLRNTKNWKLFTIGNDIFHYEQTINEAKVKEYVELRTEFDAKLNIKNKLTELYCCDNILQLLNLIGVTYKADYNGRSASVFSAASEDTQLIVSGNSNSTFENFDLHDLWHDRLSLVISRRKVNRPIDEGYAYLNGGSWGISWKDVLSEFKEKIASDRNADWAKYKENQEGYTGINGDHFKVDFIVNALILQKIELEKGFAGVWEFLKCGPVEKGNENYYAALESLTGITKENYNEKVWELIDEVE